MSIIGNENFQKFQENIEDEFGNNNGDGNSQYSGENYDEEFEQHSDVQDQKQDSEAESDFSETSEDDPKNVNNNQNKRKKKKKERIETQIAEAQKKYTGQVLQEKRDGYGIEVHTQNETEYHGYWRKDVYHGEGIFFSKKDECFFKGKWVKGQKDCGIEIFPNGDQYEGKYLNGKFHGEGCLHNNSMHYRYEGEFKNGHRDGYCKNETYPDGSFYQGTFKKNQKHGKGKLVFRDQKQRDSAYYEGDFVKGVPSGFGIYVAYSYERSKSIMPNVAYLQQVKYDNEIRAYKPTDPMEMTLMTEETMGYSTKRDYEETGPIDDGFNNTQNKQERDEWYYEGEFVEGYKHGLGRYYEPNGSYYYCQWEFDKKVGDILYYNAANHKWRVFRFKNLNDVNDDYLPPDNKVQLKHVQDVIHETQGFPPEDIDAHKSKIDECGISGDNFEDNIFLSMESSINQIYDDNVKDVPPITFFRIIELQQLNNGKKELFEHPIRPSQIKLNKFSDHQLITVIEALTKLPSLLQKVFTIKYELDTVCYLTLKLYIEGKWKEFVIDDYIPCLRVNKESMFSNTNSQEIGWIALQKVFCKYFKQYYYYFKPYFPKMAKQYLQMLTGLPCKTIEWHNIKVDYQSEQLNDLEKKIWKSLNSPNNPAQIAVAYLRESAIQRYSLHHTQAYIVVDFVKDEDVINDLGSQDRENQFILVHNMNPEQKIETKEKDIYESPGIAQMLKVNGVTKPNEYYTIFSLKEFVRHFGEIHILLGINSQVQNSLRIQHRISDLTNNDNRFYLKFQINLPTKILFNVEQHFKDGDEPHFPVRIILANEKDAYTNSKKEFIQNKIIRQMKSSVKDKKDKEELIQQKQNEIQLQNSDEELEQAASRMQTPTKLNKSSRQLSTSPTKKKVNIDLSSTKQQSQIVEEPQLQQQQSTIQDETTQIIDPIKRKNLPFKYVFGKGQKKQQNLFKTNTLKAGIYIILLQVEGPDNKATQKKPKNLDIDLSVSLFSESLIHIETMDEPENFLRNLYEHHIYTTELKHLSGHRIEHFSRSDLQDRERGCHDLIITQYFLKREGTYLQYLQNQSYDKSSKSWRQKLYFRTENMKILDQNDPHKVDVHLLPQNETLVVIQQQGAKNYNLEGGEGICIIDKIGKSKASEGEEDEEDEIAYQQRSIKDITKGIRQKKEQRNSQQFID